MKKGILVVRTTKRGKIFVQLDRLNGKPPMPLSYVSFENTNLNGKDCTYEVDKKGIFVSISVGGKVVWKKVVEKSNTQNRNSSSNTQNRGSQTSSNKQSQGFEDSFSLADTLLPKDIRDLKGQLTDIDNFALKFKKAARYEINHRGDNYKFLFYKNDYRTKTRFEIVPNYGHTNFGAIIKRQNTQVEVAFPNKNRRFSSSLQWRMVIGLGGESVYETGMTLHPVYGIPYIPSSSIKGILRSWIISQLFDNSESKAISTSQVFCTLFGCPKDIKDGKIKLSSALNGSEFQGTLRFFDAFPNQAPKLKTDIMNVHYKDWYKEVGYQAPTDTQSTNPIPFLTIDNDNNLAFAFNIAITENQQLRSFNENIDSYIQETSLTADSNLLDFANYWLKSALENHGIGAKTAVGYGYMQ
jgi:CRISPR-associated protein Cmr6